MLSQVRSGGIEFFTLSGLILSTLVPSASITGIGFAFHDYDTVWKALDGDLGGCVRREIAKANLVAFDRGSATDRIRRREWRWRDGGIRLSHAPSVSVALSDDHASG